MSAPGLGRVKTPAPAARNPADDLLQCVNWRWRNDVMGQKPTNGRELKLDQCPLWSKSDQNIAMQRLSAKCHKRTHAPQQTASLFDHIVGASEQRQGTVFG
jgi:hypothetical protein